MIEKEKNDARLEKVVKANTLIRNTRYSLSEQEQKILIYLLSKIDRNDTEIKNVRVNLYDYCEIAGISRDSNNLAYIKKSIKNIADTSWWIATDKDTEILFRWIDTVELNKEDSNCIINIKLSSSLKPFLLELTKNFTQYELINILALRGKYTIRMYEILKSYMFHGIWRVRIDELREIIECNKYKQFKEFNRNILKPSIKEINEYTDIEVSYKMIKEGKFITEIEFYIDAKRDIQISLDMIMRRNERLE